MARPNRCCHPEFKATFSYGFCYGMKLPFLSHGPNSLPFLLYYMHYTTIILYFTYYFIIQNGHLGAYSLQKTCQSAHPPRGIREDTIKEHQPAIRNSIINLQRHIISIICIINIKSIINISDIIIMSVLIYFLPHWCKKNMHHLAALGPPTATSQ